MDDIHDIAPTLRKGQDGIWYSPENVDISYPADGNDICMAVEDQSFWFKHRNACIVAAVSAFPPGDRGPICDIGGGNGFVSTALVRAGFDVVLVEPGRSGAANAKKRGLENVICSTMQTAGFSDNLFSAIGLFDVLEHMDDDRAFLRSIHALLKDNGTLYMTVPAYPWLWSGEDNMAGHIRRYTRASLSSVVELDGFEVVYASYIFRFLPLPIFLLRTIPHRLGLTGRADDHRRGAAQHVVSLSLVMRVVNRMLAAEVSNIREKQSMCFGGSCLLVARKVAGSVR